MKILTDPTRTFTDFHKTGINGGNGGSWSSSLLENNMETKTRRVDWYPEVPGFWFRGRPVPPGALLWVRFMWWFFAIFLFLGPFLAFLHLFTVLINLFIFWRHTDVIWNISEMTPELHFPSTLFGFACNHHWDHWILWILSCPYSIRLLSPNYVVM